MKRILTLALSFLTIGCAGKTPHTTVEQHTTPNRSTAVSPATGTSPGFQTTNIDHLDDPLSFRSPSGWPPSSFFEVADGFQPYAGEVLFGGAGSNIGFNDKLIMDNTRLANMKPGQRFLACALADASVGYIATRDRLEESMRGRLKTWLRAGKTEPVFTWKVFRNWRMVPDVDLCMIAEMFKEPNPTR